VTYQLGTPAGAEEEGGRGKKGKAKEAQPSPYDVFEAVVGLADWVTDASSDRIRPGVGGLALHTDAAAVLHTLGNWFRSVGLAPEAGAAAVTSPSAAAGGEPNPEAQYAAIASLSGLSLATGSLASVLSLLEVLMAHDKPLPAPVAAGMRAFLRRVDEQYDELACPRPAQSAAGWYRAACFDTVTACCKIKKI